MINAIKKIFQNDKKALITSILFISVSVFILYSPSINGSFVYDDDSYINDNYYTQDFSSEGIQKIWSNYIFGNYNPVTITSLALDYELFGTNTSGYHIVNIILHLLTTILILFFVKELTGNYSIGIIASFIFAIHPVHVESVSWISGRKDVLYTFFFILSLIFYLKYLKDKSKANYFYILLFFVLSCLSKAVAVVLPIVLILIDYLGQRKIDKHSLLEKIPFFVISIIIGLIAIDAQSRESALRIQEQYSILDKFLLSGYALSFYIEKLFYPMNLSANYPFPKAINGVFPLSTYLLPLVLLPIVFGIYYTKKITRKYTFGILFFVVSVAPVLQIAAVGNAITADRFAYLPSFAFVLLIAWGMQYLFVRNKNKKLMFFKREVVPIFIIWILFLGFTTYNRAKVWENEFTLFSDMIEKNPAVAFYYNNLGLAYFEKKKDYTKAKEYFEKAISLKPDYSMAFNNLGNLYLDTKQNDMAYESYLKAIKSDSLNAVAHNNLGLFLIERNEFEKAGYYLRKAIEIDKYYFDGLNNYASVLIAKKNFNEAKKALNKAISINTKSAISFINLAGLYYESNNNEKAEEYLLIALEKEPENKEAQTFLDFIRNPDKDISSGENSSTANMDKEKFEQGIKFMNDGNLFEAEKIFKQLIIESPNFVDAYVKLAMIQTNLKKYVDAINTFNEVLQLQPDNTIMLKNLAVVYQKSGKMNKVVECYQKAAKLGDAPAQEWLNLNGIRW